MNQTNQHPTTESGHKEPWLAVNLSKLLPGIGQFYAGTQRKGIAIFLSYLLLSVVSGWFILGTSGNLLFGMVLFAIAFFVLPIWNLFDAYYSAKSQNSAEFESTRKQGKDAWLAVFLSGFIPGLGHIYLKQWISSILFLTVLITTVFIASSQSPELLLLAQVLRIILVLFSFYHVYCVTPSRREQTQRTILLFITGFFGISVILSTVLAVVIRQFVAEARYIPSASMIPTLKVDDRLIINKLVYQFNQPERGDIIIFFPTKTLRKQNFNGVMIQRIIGLPGEEVQVKRGQVYINNQPLAEPYIFEKPQYEWGPMMVPQNHYFVLGDNRNNSYDSHYWGFVPRDHIIGKATQRFYPFDRLGSLVGK